MDLSRARILIIRLSAIGDVLHATPVARALRRALPAAHIAWLASPPADELLAACPEIDELLVWDRRPFDRAVAHGRFLEAFRLLREARALLAPRRFDVALDVQDLLLTGILARLSGAPRRIGVRERHEGAGFFMTEKAPKMAEPHKVRRYLASLAPLGIVHEETRIALQLPAALAGFAAPFFAARAIAPDRPILLVSLCTTWQSKEWPPERFCAALAALPEDVQIVFLGSGADRPVIEEARKTLEASWRGKAVSVAGETSLRRPADAEPLGADPSDNLRPSARTQLLHRVAVPMRSLLQDALSLGHECLHEGDRSAGCSEKDRRGVGDDAAG